MKPGNYNSLSKVYSRYRVGYGKSIVRKIIQFTKKNEKFIKAADLGCGTGIFTRQLKSNGKIKIIGIDPSKEMLTEAKKHKKIKIDYRLGKAENTKLKSSSLDLVTMASPFHWVNSKMALKEINRILRKNGVFAALWNPRDIYSSKVEKAVNNLLLKKFGYKNEKSSGNSKSIKDLKKKLQNSKYFKKIYYFENKYCMNKTKKII